MNLSLADQAYELLKRDIIACVLWPGQQIAQAHLAQQYNLGLTHIRDALQRLAQNGLVQPLPRIGYMVSPITFSDLHEIFELRLIVESAAARLAVLNASDEQLEAIARKAVFRYTYGDRVSYSLYLARNADFHRSVALAGGNQRLADAVSRVLDELTRVFHLVLDAQDRADEKETEHIQLAVALCERDSQKVQHLTHTEIERSEERVLEALKGRKGGNVILSRGPAAWFPGAPEYLSHG